VPRQASSHIDSPAAVGGRLREARRAAGLRQVDLTFPGCTTGYISRLERGERTPSLQVVRELARRLAVSEAWLARGDEARSADDLLRDADLALRLGDAETARRLCERLAGSAEPSVRARAEAGLGRLALAAGALGDAIERLERAFELAPELDDVPAAEALARALTLAGEEEAALALCTRELGRADERQDPVRRLRFSVLRADALADAAAFAEAAEDAGRALDGAPDGRARALARHYWEQSRAHELRSEPEAASRAVRRALELLDACEHALTTARAHQTLARRELDARRPAEALTLIERGRSFLADAAGAEQRAAFDLMEARALALLGRLDEAVALAGAGASGLREARPVEAGRSYAEIASVFERSGETARALELLEHALELLERQPNRFLAEAYARYGELLEREGRVDEAFAIYKKAAHLRSEPAGSPERVP
jgi:tetratricopeptide (TPR) repeat protein